MSMEAIRRAYDVPAKRGRRVIYHADGEERRGIISGTRGEYLRVMFDGERHSELLHPSWDIDYLLDEPVVSKLPTPPPYVRQPRPAGQSRGVYGKTLLKDESRVQYMIRMGLGLVMMQEQELDANGRREQSAEDPKWSTVERFVNAGN